ncbi:MAG TPA: hypothetical protein VF406_12910 [Thermodesulfobacteriota bacterium]
MPKTNPEAARLTEAAEAAVAKLEALGENEPFAEPLAAAERAVAALEVPARASLFPEQLEPVDAGVLADWQDLRGDLHRLRIAESLAELHGHAFPELQRVIRGPRGQDLVRRAAWAASGALGREPEAVVAEQLATFTRLVAGQLVGQAEHEPWATILGATVPALRARLLAARTALEQRAAAAAERLRQEEAEAERVLAEATVERRRALAERLERMPASRLFTVPVGIGEVDQVTAGALRRRIQAGVYDDNAAFLERLEREVAALEAVAR